MRMTTTISTNFDPSKEFILHNLEYFAIDDAILLAELNYNSAHTNDSLYLLAHCFMRADQKENAYNLLNRSELSTPDLRFIYAKCCYDLKKLSEAEKSLRMDYNARLHPTFDGTAVKPFAHALLAKVFSETGRIDEALKENRLCLEENILSWSSIKAQCELGSNDIERIFPKLIASVSTARNCLIEKTNRMSCESMDSQISIIEKPVVKEMEERNIKIPTRRQRSTLGSRKDAFFTRKRTDSTEIRRSSRNFVSQDSENMSHGPRSSSRSNSTTQSSVSTRSSQDKQLRSMNRINEIHLSMNLPCVASFKPPLLSSAEKLTESAEDLSDNSVNVVQNVSKKCSFGLQAVLAPLSSHNQNALLEERGSASILETNTHESNHISQVSLKLRSPAPLLHSVLSYTLSNIMDDTSHWTPVFADIAECIYHLALIQSSLSHYKIELALERCAKMPEHCSNCAMAQELAARVYFERLDYRKTKEILEAVHRSYPHRTSGMEVLSTALWHIQDSHRLSILAAELTRTARHSAETWCVAGNCYSVQKQHDTAVDCFERAISLNPHFAYAFCLLGHELLDTDQLDKAAASFRRALILCPTDYRAWFGLGLMHYKKGQLPLARLNLNQAARINPHNSVLLCQLSVVYQALHNNEKAMELLERALSIAPENVACRFYKARLLYEMHEYEKCREELNDVKLFAHDEAQIFFLLGRVHKKLGDTHLALINFSWAAEMDPRGEQNHNINEDPYDDEPSPTVPSN